MDSHFYGRKKELEELESLYSRDGCSSCAITGRRRIGKSELIEQFCRNKDSILIEFSNVNEEDHLKDISDAISAFTGNDPTCIPTIRDAIKDLGDLCRERKIVIAFDEFPYLLRAIPSAAGHIQHFMDKVLPQTESMFIICGSMMSVMVDETTNPSKPLYGRFDRMMRLDELPVSDCRGFHPHLSDTELIDTYLLFGGIPRFHKIVSGLTYKEILGRAMTDDWVSVEAELLIRTELESPNTHISIINAIASGNTSRVDIANAAKLKESTCGNYLSDLIKIGIVDMKTPMFRSGSRPNYYIKDNITAFYHEVVQKNRSAVMYRHSDILIERLNSDISTFLGRRFELLCRDYFRRNYLCDSIGSWWGKIDGENTDIDMVAVVIDENGVKRQVFGECKHRNKVSTWSDLDSLNRKVSQLQGVSGPNYVLFSWSGFKENLAEEAEERGIMLITPAELVDEEKAPAFPKQSSTISPSSSRR